MAPTPASASFPYFLRALVLVGVASGLTWMAAWPSSVSDRDVAARDFSALRATDSLAEALAAAGGPHPVGTAANARFRDEVVRILEEAGWSVERRRAVGCRGMRTCAEVENLVARLPGQGSGPAVVVATHTDSVPAAPGAGDDGIGVGVSLELARNLAADPPDGRPVWLLLDEGEEMGLLGAEAFVRETDPGAVGALVNLEARGTEGPVWLFEVSDGGGALVSAYGRSVPMPSTSSIAYAVYRRMPNDTDLTVFKGAGIPGLGLAIIDGGARYHTPMDDLDHLSRESVQRMGDTTLALVRELASSSLPLPRREAVFFDLGTRWTVRWPAAWTVPLALLAFVVVVVSGRRGGRFHAADSLLGLLFLVVALGAGAASGGALAAVLGRLGAFPFPFAPPLGRATWAAVALAGAAVLALGVAFVSRPGLDPVRAGARRTGLLAGLAVLGLALALLDPGAAYPWILAPLVGGLAELVRPDRREGLPGGTGMVFAGIVGAACLASLVRILPVGLGPVGLAGSGLLAAVVLAPVATLVPTGRRRWWPAAVFAVVALGLTVGAATMPPISVDEPQPLNLRTVVDADTGRSWAVVTTSGPLPGGVEEAGEWARNEIPGREDLWRSRSIPLGDDSVLEGPVVARRPAPEGRLRLAIRSPRAPWSVLISAPDMTRIRSVTWPGLPERVADPGVEGLRLQAVPPEGVEVELDGKLEGELIVVARELGLAGPGRDLADRRPVGFVPIGMGDTTEVHARFRLEDLRRADTESAEAGSEEAESEGADELAGFASSEPRSR